MTIGNELVESNQIELSYGKNYITNDILNINTLVKKGSVPIIRLIPTNNQTILSIKKNSDLYPDYVCLNISAGIGIAGFTNFSALNDSFKSSKSNIAVQFIFEEPTLINLTVSYAYSSFGTFQPFLYTKFGGNLYRNQCNQMISIRNVENFQFESKINTFFN